jgi:hypothetical protein
MINLLKFPESFPDKGEEQFLKLILSNDEDFISLWEQWQKEIIFDDLDYATVGLLPLLYLRLKKFKIQNEITGRIKGVYKLAWFKNQKLLDTVGKIIEIFKINDIPIIILKGLPLLLYVYKDPGARFLGDADILINPGQAEKAMNLMLKNGWTFKYHPFISTINQSNISVLNKVTHATTFKNKDNIEIDIHWNVFHIDTRWNFFDLLFLKKDGPAIFNELHWKNSGQITINNVQTKMLCVEDMLIHVIAHGARGSRYRALRWVADAVNIIRNFDINWNFFIENSKKFDLNVEIYFALAYLGKNFPKEVPELVLKEISNLPLNRKKIIQYQKITATQRFSLLGNNLPFLWYCYWNFEAKGRFPVSLYNFAGYLCNNWGLTKKRQIPLFILGKYKKIITHYFNLSKNFIFNPEKP